MDAIKTKRTVKAVVGTALALSAVIACNQRPSGTGDNVKQVYNAAMINPYDRSYFAAGTEPAIMAARPTGISAVGNSEIVNNLSRAEDCGIDVMCGSNAGRSVVISPVTTTEVVGSIRLNTMQISTNYNPTTNKHGITRYSKVHLSNGSIQENLTLQLSYEKQTYYYWIQNVVNFRPASSTSGTLEFTSSAWMVNAAGISVYGKGSVYDNKNDGEVLTSTSSDYQYSTKYMKYSSPSINLIAKVSRNADGLAVVTLGYSGRGVGSGSTASGEVNYDKLTLNAVLTKAPSFIVGTQDNTLNRADLVLGGAWNSYVGAYTKIGMELGLYYYDSKTRSVRSFSALESATYSAQWKGERGRQVTEGMDTGETAMGVKVTMEPNGYAVLSPGNNGQGRLYLNVNSPVPKELTESLRD